MYSEVRKVKGEQMSRTTLDLPEDLLRELESRAGRSGKSLPDFIREELELRYLHRLPKRERGDISDRPEVQRAIRIQDEIRKRHEGSGYNASEFIRRMRDGGQT
jgi:hypothetical protein